MEIEFVETLHLLMRSYMCETNQQTFSRGSGMQLPDGFPGFTIETSFGVGLVSERILSNQSARDR